MSAVKGKRKPARSREIPIVGWVRRHSAQGYVTEHAVRRLKPSGFLLSACGVYVSDSLRVSEAEPEGLACQRCVAIERAEREVPA